MVAAGTSGSWLDDVHSGTALLVPGCQRILPQAKVHSVPIQRSGVIGKGWRWLEDGLRVRDKFQMGREVLSRKLRGVEKRVLSDKSVTGGHVTRPD